MSRPAPEIQLSTEEKETLLHWMRSTKTERRMVERARVILLAANGLNGKEIAARMETRTARVSKWLRRFAKDRIAGLLDAPRPGEKRRKYNPATEERILKALDEPPPAGYSRWNGRLLAEHLCQVSKDQVWRVMRKHHLSLARRQSWCVSTDPEFSRKAADVVGLYLNPPENALVLCVDENPAFKRWGGRRAGSACPTVERSLALHTNTSAMAQPRSLRPWRWPLDWSMQGIIGAGADANFWIS